MYIRRRDVANPQARKDPGLGINGICSIHEISRDSFSSIDLINNLVPHAQRSRARVGSCIPRTDHLYNFDIDSIRNNK
jgi:hypothetical protein